MADPKELIVIGGGVAGYPAALKAARLGARVTLIEEGRIGGMCLNRGCIPTKSLLHAVDLVGAVREAERFGIRSGRPEVDLARVMERKSEVVTHLREGVEKLLAAKGIQVVAGREIGRAHV